MQRAKQLFVQVRTACNLIQRNKNVCRLYSTESTNENDNNFSASKQPEKSNVKLSGFAKSIKKHKEILQNKPHEPSLTFAEMMRYSKFIDLGNPEGKIVIGKIYRVVDNDLYIDFGWKFHCVCQKPAKLSEGYVKNAMVKIKIKQLELSSKFLGSDKDLTLLEADCTLLGLVSTPFGIGEKKLA